MEYSEIFQFKGTWRSYQARVLKNLAQYKKDGHIHIVAAPGSGKTTLGIELIIRFNKPALILAPSVTIREQWVERITEAFLKDGQQAEDYLSQNLKAPKLITVATYQALHSAMTKYRGTEEEDDDEVKHSEEVDYSDFDVIAAMKSAGTGVLCLDECHHLRSEWWKALEGFQAGLGNPDIIALTATPPYDSTPALWERYMNMCGEIDEEITIPELVKEGSLCAHQDFVYFNYPTEEEKEQIAQFQERSRSMYEKLMQSESFEMALDEIVWLITLLANQSILIHNLKDKEHPKELLTEDVVELLTTPLDLAGYKTAITEALYKGTKRNVESEKDAKNAQVG